VRSIWWILRRHIGALRPHVRKQNDEKEDHFECAKSNRKWAVRERLHEQHSTSKTSHVALAYFESPA
jgi:hypothetical protein